VHRYLPILLLGAVLLLVNGLQAPASPPRATDATVASLEQAAPTITAVNAELERLRERLATTPQYPPPQRDPFRFGRRPEPTVAKPATIAPPPIVESGPELPRLVAIVESKGSDGGVTYRAVVGVSDDVRVVSAGETVDAFVVRSITSDRLELIEKATNRSHLLTLK
jgi:hypothetical protein